MIIPLRNGYYEPWRAYDSSVCVRFYSAIRSLSLSRFQSLLIEPVLRGKKKKAKESKPICKSVNLLNIVIVYDSVLNDFEKWLSHVRIQNGKPVL